MAFPMKRLVRPGLLALGLLTLFPAAAPAAGKTMLYVYELPDGSRMMTNYKLNNRDYRLVHSGLISGRGGRPAASRNPGFTHANPNAYDDLIRRIAREHRVDFTLVKAIMHVESAFNPHARSHKGAHGLMQLMPQTAQRYGVDTHDLYDPYHNIQAGVRYLKFLSTQFSDIRLVIAAYNAGENAVFTYRGIPPYGETMNYVTKVLLQKRRYSAQS